MDSQSEKDEGDYGLDRSKLVPGKHRNEEYVKENAPDMYTSECECRNGKYDDDGMCGRCEDWGPVDDNGLRERDYVRAEENGQIIRIVHETPSQKTIYP